MGACRLFRRRVRCLLPGGRALVGQGLPARVDSEFVAGQTLGASASPLRGDASTGALLDRAQSSATVAELADVVAGWLDEHGYTLPSIYLMIAGRLRCVGVRGYWQILEGLSLERGVLAKAFRSGEPQLIKDVADDPEYIAALPGVVSELCLPLRYHGAVVGLLNVESRRTFDPADLDFISAAGHVLEQCMAALGGPDPESPWQRLAWRAAALSELDEPHAIAQFTVEAACDVTGLDSAVLVLRDGDRYVVQTACGALGPTLRALPDDVLRRIAGWTEAATSAYTQGAATGSGFEGHEELRNAGVRALASATLPSNGGRHGFLLAAGRQIVQLDYARLQHLEILAAHASSALHTARALDALRDKASQDSLTGLGHSATFHADLARGLTTAAAHATAVLLIDIDNFKVVNDTRGHAEGDRVLIDSAALFRSGLRAGDGLYRIGGDEFAAIVSVNDEADALAVARHINAATRDSGVAEISIGITVIPAGETPQTDAVLAQADLALYETKTSGRDGVTLYRTAMATAAGERAQLIAELAGAIDRDELSLVYQPVVDLDEAATVLGLEALVRWHNPRRGTVPPLEFIPLAEQNALIGPIGRWVLRTACEQLAEWQRQGVAHPAVRIAVNVSAVELNATYVDFVATTLLTTGVTSDQLVLEVTESVFIGESDAVGHLLRLRELGVHIAVDDFGTGYSSLSYLQRLPFDILKMDRSFVAALDNPVTFAIARAIVQVGRALGMSLVAEGVERPDQVADLRRLGCEHAQGYLWSRPVPAEQVAQACSWIA